MRNDFPRSKERGLIEARNQVAIMAEIGDFPRSKERGLIEAMWILRCKYHGRPFRVRKSAASLKQCGPDTIDVSPSLSAFERARPH